ncbi:hypothetical protein RF11_05628 [Thelohanellus kitauei]|uniref:Uncharacterized protein n=1 Tax=Thelohanellus kitauei TaxID=669202 RepID=A0A0C2N7G3_THEKT|nr:hypothetical protein RF11_05628 [Thelohanellus kitauei]
MFESKITSHFHNSLAIPKNCLSTPRLRTPDVSALIDVFSKSSSQNIIELSQIDHKREIKYEELNTKFFSMLQLIEFCNQSNTKKYIDRSYTDKNIKKININMIQSSEHILSMATVVSWLRIEDAVLMDKTRQFKKCNSSF